ncbi:ABC transporter permease subunit [Treponema pectinovorum]|uniref:ABC transporter permease subunit n=1 Tax=Treponema pectinovorum TaxID=164 RepID=UPI0011CCA47C|nr:ABC transporter permease subunit [Treponema pectinovorum]
MRFLRFLFRELILHGAIFALVGTVALSALYLLAIGASGHEFLNAGKSFLMLISGSEDYSIMHPGFTSAQIIASGAAVTLPLALISLVFVIIIALTSSSFAVTSRYMALHHGEKSGKRLEYVLSLLASMLAAVPLFVGFWFAYSMIGSVNFLFIALMTVICGGLSWDAANFLKTDMMIQVEQTHAIVFSTLGHNLGRFFPIPGTYSGYLFSSSLPRFIPYLAGKVPAIIGSVTIAEIAFSFPGLGSNLIDALISTNTDLLVSSVFILLCVNAVVSFLVKAILFLIYPRWYEKAI